MFGAARLPRGETDGRPGSEKDSNLNCTPNHDDGLRCVLVAIVLVSAMVKGSEVKG